MKLPPILASVGMLLALGHQLSGTDPPAPAPPDTSHVRQALARLAALPELATGTLGFFLAPLATPDQPLVTRLHQQGFITASTIKTLTTGVALERLGPEFQFETTLAYNPTTGDVIIRGSGDPSLARGGWDDLFTDWTNALAAAGVHEVRGRVLADESAWESTSLPGGWTWLDIGNYYAPPLTPLTFHDNEFRLYFRLTGRPGTPAGFYDAEPWPDGLRIIDAVRIGRPGTGDQAYVGGGPGASVYTVRGTLATDAGKAFIRGALPDAAHFCALEFTRWLHARQVPVHGTPETTRRLASDSASPPSPPPGRTLHVHRSKPLGELLVPINHQSLNLDCECLLLTLGAGTADAGVATVRLHLAAKNLPLAGFLQTDGSGLSRTNMVTPELLARANASFLTGPYASVFRASLPIAGEAGTLRSIGGETRGRIRAKSGTIERVKCYVGTVEPAAGTPFIFTVMANNYDGSIAPVFAALDELFDALSRL